MNTAFIISNGVVTNAIILNDGNDPAEFGAVFGPADAGIGWSFDGAIWSPPAAPSLSFDNLRAAKLAAIAATADALLAAGAPVTGGLHVAVDDSSRQDVTALGATAAATLSGAMTWPESYSRGWITVENIRIPLAKPADGLALAASVGNWYAALVQHRRDLKDAALAAEDTAALDAIDINAGWPA